MWFNYSRLFTANRRGKAPPSGSCWSSHPIERRITNFLRQYLFKRSLFFISMIQWNSRLYFCIHSVVCWIQWNLCLLKTNSLKLDSVIVYKKSKAFSGQYIRKIIIVWSFLKASHIRMMQEMNASPARGTLHNINGSTAFSSVLVHLAKRKKITIPCATIQDPLFVWIWEEPGRELETVQAEEARGSLWGEGDC